MVRFHTSLTFFLVLITASIAHPQTTNPALLQRALITQPVDDQHRVTLAGNTRSAVATATDLGLVPDGLPLEHMLLQLQRPPELSQALDQYLNQLADPTSPNYHRWLTANEFGTKFGLAQTDLSAVTGWLESHGFVINQVLPSRVTIDFSGTAGQIRQAFHTEIHSLEFKGQRHIANLTDPQIPAALAPAITGIASLHDFKPHLMKKDRHLQYTVDSSTHPVVPADLATIYNLNPLFARGINGKGQTIVLIEDSDVYSTSDWTTFRNTFGLASYTSASFTQLHPGSCSDPGVVPGTDGEAELDAQWASAAAPGAAIELAACADTTTTFGGLIALQNILNASGTPPALVSISYGECEAENGAAANATYSAVYQQAVAEGVSVFVSSGDEGAASCDAGADYSSLGIGVSGFASTPYNVAVGGTDFGDTYAGTTNTFWNSSNTSTYESAKSYVPEIPWNDSCAGGLLASFNGYSTSYGTNGFCNSSTGLSEFLNTGAGSGGPSACATGSPSATGVVGGTCHGYAKPSWQTGLFGNPSDGVRDIPDVALFSADGIWGHYYVFCFTDIANGGASCSGDPSGWAGGGGTSFASPIMAGIQALVNQNTGKRWGNPNPYYYALASSEYGSAGNSSCLSNSPKSSCTFYDITQGDMDLPCFGAANCYGSSGTRRSPVYGVLSTSSSSLSPAYPSANGWDFATGIGSLNATNLVNNWNGGTTAPVTSSATYTGADTTTQGAWTGVYGGDGFQIANDNSSLSPSYVSLGFSGAATYTWAFPTTDPRGLETGSGSSTRIASTYYSPTSASFSINLSLTDGNAHRVALYMVDWSDNGRSDTITIADAATNTVLSTQSFSNFNNGLYAVYTIKGSVIITVTCTTSGLGDNPLLSALFFGPAGTASTASASYTGLDTTTQGTWTGTYGSDGFQIANNGSNPTPSYASIGYIGAVPYTWAYPTSDARALQVAAGASTRIASTFYTSSSSSFSIHLTLTDGNTHRVALYMVDWSNNGRSDTITIADAATYKVLDTESFSNFNNGQYGVWNIKGDVLITITCTTPGTGDNPLLSALFFGPATTTATSAATFSGVDTSTQGAWTGKYGADGFAIANDSSSALPFYASSLAFNGTATYTWSYPTSDPRALQVSSGATNRIASTYYTAGSQSFTISLNLTDGNTHRVSLYLLDWSNNQRNETISIADATSKAVLSTESFANFDSGQYAVWTIKGNVVITVTCTSGGSGNNPLVSAVFFN